MIPDNTVFLIPARKNSKGLPGKNRKLFKSTASIIPKELSSLVYVSTDDELLLEEANKYGFNGFKRPNNICLDTSSLKECIEHFISEKNIKPETRIIMLCLTYPNRSWEDVIRCVSFYERHKPPSMLCRQEIEISPYIMLFESDNFKGEQVIEHNLYRRQDYRKCFHLSHYVYICVAKETDNLNDNLYNKNTLYYPIREVLDIDTQEDFQKHLGEQK
jgi:CMP-N-acetylneuraminic acid synthetase